MSLKELVVRKMDEIEVLNVELTHLKNMYIVNACPFKVGDKVTVDKDGETISDGFIGKINVLTDGTFTYAVRRKISSSMVEHITTTSEVFKK